MSMIIAAKIRELRRHRRWSCFWSILFAVEAAFYGWLGATDDNRWLQLLFVLFFLAFTFFTIQEGLKWNVLNRMVDDLLLQQQKYEEFRSQDSG